MKIQCSTLFDCSPTGVTGRFNRNQLPMQDRMGREVADQAAWNRSRNQQRNWETLLQIVQLRSQVTVLQEPTREHNQWNFVFEVDSDEVYGGDFANLYDDAKDIPMLRGLDEATSNADQLICSGDRQNIWFQKINI